MIGPFAAVAVTALVEQLLDSDALSLPLTIVVEVAFYALAFRALGVAQRDLASRLPRDAGGSSDVALARFALAFPFLFVALAVCYVLQTWQMP